MNTSVYHSTHVIIFVASFDEQESLDVARKWVPLVRGHVPLDGSLNVLAINKADSKDQSPAAGAMTRHEIGQTCEQLGAELFEVSAKQNTNVSEMLEYAGVEVRQKFPGEGEHPVGRPKKTGKMGRKGCC
jgi:signal recognition particle receptor subunit beta